MEMSVLHTLSSPSVFFISKKSCWAITTTSVLRLRPETVEQANNPFRQARIDIKQFKVQVTSVYITVTKC